ncbi:MAG: PQQ-dependent sugar dehydrogenase [Acidobacteria bacterium]|nr:PQQ-dependent sugar dehydrogenase [Acidobacteriota bacterium]
MARRFFTSVTVTTTKRLTTLRNRIRSSSILRVSIVLTLLIAGLFASRNFGLPTNWPEPGASAASLPSGFTETLVATGMASPTAFAIAPDGRIFVCQQGGSLRVIQGGNLLATPFMTLSVNSSGERGLLGIAFDPDFAANNFLYVYYTTSTSPIHNRISRFTANGNVVAAGSEVILLDLDNLSAATNHNGGALHFGPDGKLYSAVGENATSSNSQTLSNLLGKMLRLNADGSIPSDNPFFNTATGNNRAIWALGLRNPFTFNFQPGTGRMFINDVGQNTWEEINDGIAGSNYGWPNCESPCSPTNPNFRDPIYYYSNDASTCAITGGTFYNPATATFPAQYVGKYFFADYCAGWIKYIDPASPPSVGAAATFATGLSSPVDLQVSSADGGLYYLHRGSGGQLWKIQYTANLAPTITQHPANQTVSEGQTATFTVSASGSAPLSYQWRKNNMDINGATLPSYTTPATTLADSGAQYSCFVSNAFGNDTSNAATLTVTTNQAPTATITQPMAGTLYSGGQTINYAGTGTDPDQGTLPASAFTWQVDFHHDTHTHPFIAAFSGITSGSFVIPTAGETATNVWYRIHLTVTDAGGLQHSVFRDINPQVVNLTLDSSPAGLQLTLDGQPVASPHTVTSVVGIERSIGAVSPQTVGATTYIFNSWSDGGAATHTISTPVSDATRTAAFSGGGLMFYPLQTPIRLLDTRAGQTACDAPGAPIAGGTDRTQLARVVCGNAAIPFNALAITGNITPVPSSSGFVTLYPSDASRPLAANSNFVAGKNVNNVFTVGLGHDGAFKIYASTTTDVVIDLTGYYAPPGFGGLYFHPLPHPIRRLDTRPGQPGCDTPGMPIIGGTSLLQGGGGVCNGVTVPNSAQALVGNATVVNPAGPGYITLYPNDPNPPFVSSGNYGGGDIVNTPFTVRMRVDVAFRIFSLATTDVVVDVLGYYSPDASDVNGAGLLFYPLGAPVRLLDSRSGATACTTPGTPFTGGVEYSQQARGICAGQTVAANALAVVGNVTTVNPVGGFLTLWPGSVARPLVATSNFTAGQTANRHFTVGLGTDGTFGVYAAANTDLVIDLSGYFAP